MTRKHLAIKIMKQEGDPLDQTTENKKKWTTSPQSYQMASCLRRNQRSSLESAPTFLYFYPPTWLNKHCCQATMQFLKNSRSYKNNKNLSLLFLSSVFPLSFWFCKLVRLTNSSNSILWVFRFSTFLDLLSFPQTKCPNTGTLEKKVKRNLLPNRNSPGSPRRVHIVLSALMEGVRILIILHATPNDVTGFLSDVTTVPKKWAYSYWSLSPLMEVI